MGDDVASPLAFLNLSATYLKSANLLNDHIDQIGPFRFAPIYFCLSHALELMLKAFLIQHSWSEAKIRSVGHELPKLIDHAKTLGLQLSFDDEDDIEQLDTYITHHEFRYPKLGTKILPEVGALLYAFAKMYNDIAEFIPTSRKIQINTD